MIKNELGALKLKVQSDFHRNANIALDNFADAFFALVDIYGYCFAFTKALDILNDAVSTVVDSVSGDSNGEDTGSV